MMAQICIHDNDEVAICMRHSVHVGAAETEFSCSRSQQDLVFTVELYQLLSNFLCSIGTAIVDYDYLEIAENAFLLLFTCDVAELELFAGCCV